MNSVKILLELSSNNGTISSTFIEGIKYNKARRCQNEENNLYSVEESEIKVAERLEHIKKIIEEFLESAKKK